MVALENSNSGFFSASGFMVVKSSILSSQTMMKNMSSSIQAVLKKNLGSWNSKRVGLIAAAWVKLLGY
jgi:hypothetical protein